MKERASFTFDKETLKILDALMKKNKFRNKSHIVELAIRLLKEQEDAEKGDEK